MVTRTCSSIVLLYSVVVIMVSCWTKTTQAFLVCPSLPAKATSVPSKNMMMMLVPITTTTMPVVPEPIVTITAASSKLAIAQSYSGVESSAESLLNQGVRNYFHHSAKTSSMLVSLEPIKKVTAEEIQAKKNTFNLIFWGGGFVAPFLATIFYFGFKFWEK